MAHRPDTHLLWELACGFPTFGEALPIVFSENLNAMSGPDLGR
jgi:hypothetical protein